MRDLGIVLYCGLTFLHQDFSPEGANVHFNLFTICLNLASSLLRDEVLYSVMVTEPIQQRLCVCVCV